MPGHNTREKSAHAPVHAEGMIKQLEGIFAEKDLVVLLDNKLNISQWCAPAAKAAKSICSSTASRLREMTSLFYSARVEELTWVQASASQYMRDMEKL